MKKFKAQPLGQNILVDKNLVDRAVKLGNFPDRMTFINYALKFAYIKIVTSKEHPLYTNEDVDKFLAENSEVFDKLD